MKLNDHIIEKIVICLMKDENEENCKKGDYRKKIIAGYELKK
ncbi:hypothetical protein GCM10026983_42700 [Gracilibacillus alcaliphilus]